MALFAMSFFIKMSCCFILNYDRFRITADVVIGAISTGQYGCVMETGCVHRNLVKVHDCHKLCESS